MFRLGAKRDLHGIQVSYPHPDREIRERAFSKLAAALDLLAQVSPARYARTVKCVPRILIFGELATLACWHWRLQLCEWHEENLRAPGTAVAEVACTLLHEATHAYHQRRGIVYHEAARWRIERLCLRTERAFARRLPPEAAALILQSVEEALTLDPNHYTDVGRIEKQLEAVEDLNVPGWAKRLAQRLGHRAIRKRRERLSSGSASEAG